MAVSLVLGMVAGMVGLLGSASAASADDGGFATRMLTLMNQQRAAAGVAPLQWSPALATAAADGQYTGCGFPVAGRATDMGVRNYFSHTILGCGTQSIFNLLSGLGIQTSGAGENIAWASALTDPLVAAERLMNDFMASPGHRANILDPNFTTVGIGSWHTAAGQTWSGGGYPLGNVYIGVQVFGHMATTTTTPPPPPAPAAPTNVKATGGDGSIAVSWTPAAGGGPADSYGAFAWDSTGYTSHSVSVCAGCTSGTITGLTNGHQYYVAVYGLNASGWGPPGFSNWVTVAAALATPTGVTLLPANGAVTATWAAANNPGAAIDGYGVFAFDANGWTNQYAWVCATCTTGTVPGLVNGRPYYAVVYAHNANGWSAPATSGWVTAGTPGSPGAVTVAPAPAAVRVSWTAAAAANAASPVDLYGVFAYDGSGYTGLYATACATCTTATVSGLTSGKPYTMVVYAHNAQGWSVPVTSGTVTPA